jgi:hypothetical protein
VSADQVPFAQLLKMNYGVQQFFDSLFGLKYSGQNNHESCQFSAEGKRRDNPIKLLWFKRNRGGVQEILKSISADISAMCL